MARRSTRSRLRPPARPEPVLSLFKGLRRLFRAALSEGRRRAAQAARDARPPAPDATPSLRFELSKDGKAIDPVAASAAGETRAGFELFKGLRRLFRAALSEGRRPAAQGARDARPPAPDATPRFWLYIPCFQLLERTNLSQNSSNEHFVNVISLLDAHSTPWRYGGRTGSGRRHFPSYHNFRFSGSICRWRGSGLRTRGVLAARAPRWRGLPRRGSASPRVSLGRDAHGFRSVVETPYAGRHMAFVLAHRLTMEASGFNLRANVARLPKSPDGSAGPKRKRLRQRQHHRPGERQRRQCGRSGRGPIFASPNTSGGRSSRRGTIPRPRCSAPIAPTSSR